MLTNACDKTWLLAKLAVFKYSKNNGFVHRDLKILIEDIDR